VSLVPQGFQNAMLGRFAGEKDLAKGVEAVFQRLLSEAERHEGEREGLLVPPVAGRASRNPLVVMGASYYRLGRPQATVAHLEAVRKNLVLGLTDRDGKMSKLEV